MANGAKWNPFSGLAPQGPRPTASMPGPWGRPPVAGIQTTHGRLPFEGGNYVGDYQPYEWQESGLHPSIVSGYGRAPDSSTILEDVTPTFKNAPASRVPFNMAKLTEAQKHHDRMRDLREKKLETLAGLMKYGQKDLGHFKKGATQLNIGPQGRAEFKTLPMMEERSYVSLEDPTVETIDQYERKRRRV